MPKILDKRSHLTIVEEFKTEEDVLMIVDENILRLSSDPEDMLAVKEIVCPFYKRGKLPDCIGCAQKTEKLTECSSNYIELVRVRPALVYDTSLNDPILRKKIPIYDTGDIKIGLACDTCYVADKCPVYKAGHSCGIAWDTNLPKNSDEFMDLLINVQTVRVRRAVLQEELDGGVADRNVSAEMDRLQNLVAAKADLSAERFSMHLTAKGSPDGNKGPGILSRIFGDAMVPKQIADKNGSEE